MTVAPPARGRAAHATLAVLIVTIVAAGCSDRDASLSSSAQRGRQVYLARCASCHASDPANPGAVGPALKGSSRELLEAKVLRGEYPPGYTPKRRTKIMPAMPALAPDDIETLSDYLR